MAEIPQAGAICYRMSGAVPEVLLVRAKRNPAHLIFPKGHIEPGENAQIAAIRELREEAGVNGEAVTGVGDRFYVRDGLLYCVTYFLVRFLDLDGQGEAGRNPTWHTVPEALDLLFFSDTRELLQAALPHIR